MPRGSPRIFISTFRRASSKAVHEVSKNLCHIAYRSSKTAFTSLVGPLRLFFIYFLCVFRICSHIVQRSLRISCHIVKVPESLTTLTVVVPIHVSNVAVQVSANKYRFPSNFVEAPQTFLQEKKKRQRLDF